MEGAEIKMLIFCCESDHDGLILMVFWRKCQRGQSEMVRRNSEYNQTDAAAGWNWQARAPEEEHRGDRWK